MDTNPAPASLAEQYRTAVALADQYAALAELALTDRRIPPALRRARYEELRAAASRRAADSQHLAELIRRDNTDPAR